MSERSGWSKGGDECDDSPERGVYAAAVEGNDERLIGLLEGGAGWDYRGVAGRQALHEAAAAPDKLGCVEALLSHGADPNALANGNTSALALAAKQSHGNAFDLLLAAGADANGKDADGMSALHWAVRKMELSKIERLLSLGADPNAKAGECGWTPLHVLCWEWRFEKEAEKIALALMKSGASPLSIGKRQREGKTGEEWTPAELANHLGKTALARLLKPFELSAREAEELKGSTESDKSAGPRRRAAL